MMAFVRKISLNLSANPRIRRMLAAGHERYASLQPREQRVLLVAAVLLPLLVFVFGIWLPLRDRARQLEASMPDYSARLVEARRLVVEAGKNGGKTPARGDLLSMVERQSRAAGIRQFITRIKPQPAASGVNRVLLQLRKAPYAKVVRFLSGMAGVGVSVSRVKLSDVAHNGLVDVDAAFMQRLRR